MWAWKNIAHKLNCLFIALLFCNIFAKFHSFFFTGHRLYKIDNRKTTTISLFFAEQI